MVSKLRNQGHEIAVHSITHRTPGICKQTADELQIKMQGVTKYIVCMDHSSALKLKKVQFQMCV